MSAEWAVGIVVPIFKGKGDIRDCSCYIVVKLFGHSIMMVKQYWKEVCRLVTVNYIPFVFMSEEGTVDAVLILTRW